MPGHETGPRSKLRAVSIAVQRRGDAAVRARAWRSAALRATCDVIEPWSHGTVARATRYPSCYELNVVRVEDAAGASAEKLSAFADRALAGMAHRLIEFEDAAQADALRADFERRGWRALRLVWMRHSSRLPEDPRIPVEELPFDAVRDLRTLWYHEDFPGRNPAAFHLQAREVAIRRGARVLVAREGNVPIAFAQLEHHGEDAEITEVYVRRDRRGAGLGTAVTRAAIAAAADFRELWITADDEDRAKDLYRRLGFQPVCKTMQFLMLAP